MSCPLLSGNVISHVRQGLEALVPNQLIWIDPVARMNGGMSALIIYFIILLIHT